MVEHNPLLSGFAYGGILLNPLVTVSRYSWLYYYWETGLMQTCGGSGCGCDLYANDMRILGAIKTSWTNIKTVTAIGITICHAKLLRWKVGVHEINCFPTGGWYLANPLCVGRAGVLYQESHPLSFNKYLNYFAAHWFYALTNNFYPNNVQHMDLQISLFWITCNFPNGKGNILSQRAWAHTVWSTWVLLVLSSKITFVKMKRTQ